MDENDACMYLPDDEPEPQPDGFIPDYDVEGDYPAYCHTYITQEGDVHVELCGRHAQIAAETTPPAVEKWTNELDALYEEWLAASLEEDRAAIATSQAFFTLWLEQQTNALQLQNVENVDSYIETLLRNQCVELCQRVFELSIE